MSIDYSKSPISKGEPRKRVQARKLRMAKAVIRTVRAKCVDRDGFCRLSCWAFEADDDRWACAGPSEWAHLEGSRRFETRGQAPATRHATAGSLMLCRRHHNDYDDRRIRIEPVTNKGADGSLVVSRGDREFYV